MAEGLVILALVAVLAGILVPAIQKVRESARGLQCRGRLAYLAAALLSFHDKHGVFPHNGGYDHEQSFALSTTRGTRTYFWGFGDPQLSPAHQRGAWTYALLPFTECDEAYKRADHTAPLRHYLCPTKGRSPVQTCPPVDPVFPGWRYDCAGRNPWSKTDYAANGLIVVERGRNLSRADLTDGASHTLLVGEKSLDPRAYDTGGWAGDGPAFSGGGRGTARAGTRLARDAVGVVFLDHWGSAHPRGANFAFADGSVRVLAYGTGREALGRLLTPSGRDEEE